MSELTDNLSADLKKTLDELASVRDDVRVRIHLAGLEAKEQWSKLENELETVPTGEPSTVSDVALAAIRGTLAKVTEFRKSLAERSGDAEQDKR